MPVRNICSISRRSGFPVFLGGPVVSRRCKSRLPQGEKHPSSPWTNVDGDVAPCLEIGGNATYTRRKAPLEKGQQALTVPPEGLTENVARRLSLSSGSRGVQAHGI